MPPQDDEPPDDEGSGLGLGGGKATPETCGVTIGATESSAIRPNDASPSRRRAPGEIGIRADDFAEDFDFGVAQLGIGLVPGGWSYA